MKFLVFFLTAVSVGADPQPEFEAGTSFVWGQATELVLRDGTYNNPVSRLVWEVPPSIAVHLGVGWPWSESTTTALELQASVPGLLGTVVDEDWNTEDGSNIRYAKSTHSVNLMTRWSLRLEQQFHWHELTWSVGGLYRYTQWEAWNGSGHYIYQNGTTADWNYYGPILAYRISWLIPYLGAGWAFHESGWTLTPDIKLSPMTWGWDRDDHNYAGNPAATFLDNVAGGFDAQLGTSVEFPENGWSWGAKASYEIAWGATGSTTATYSQQVSGNVHSSYGTYQDAAGAWFHELTLTFFVRN